MPSAAKGDVRRAAILIPDATLRRAADYVQALRSRTAQAGALLAARLGGEDIDRLDGLALLGALFDTKQPQIFAESAIAGDGSDWNLIELGLLGDASVAVAVTVFDDGQHQAPVVHATPFPAVLVYVPGALLRNDRRQPAADWAEVTTPDGQLATEGYYDLYARRLRPVLQYVNDRAGAPRAAVVTVPGLGCGQFAGPFRGRLGAQLQGVLQRLLVEYGARWPNIGCVRYDPFNECDDDAQDIHGIAFRVRPLQSGRHAPRAQLCPPRAYEEAGDDFSGCSLFSLVAWDHVSWPGNDFFAGARATDDGVKAAATDSMAVITGVAGHYDPARGMYLPPAPHRHWGAVVRETMRTQGLRLWNPDLIR